MTSFEAAAGLPEIPNPTQIAEVAVKMTLLKLKSDPNPNLFRYISL
jgi:hypothetical protein